MRWQAPVTRSDPDRDSVTSTREDEKANNNKPSTSGTPRMSVFSAALKRRKKEDKKEESFHAEMAGDAAEMVAFTDNDAHVNLDGLMTRPAKSNEVDLEIGADIRPTPNLEVFSRWCQEFWDSQRDV